MFPSQSAAEQKIEQYLPCYSVALREGRSLTLGREYWSPTSVAGPLAWPRSLSSLDTPDLLLASGRAAASHTPGALHMSARLRQGSETRADHGEAAAILAVLCALWPLRNFSGHTQAKQWRQCSEWDRRARNIVQLAELLCAGTLLVCGEEEGSSLVGPRPRRPAAPAKWEIDQQICL